MASLVRLVCRSLLSAASCASSSAFPAPARCSRLLSTAIAAAAPPYPPPPRGRLAHAPTRGRPRETPSALRSARVALRKRLGQHLLKNADVVARIVDAARVAPHETALEIGPGMGALTLHLLERARAVYAVELDARLHAIVTARAAALGLGHKLQCVRADFLDVALPHFDVLVANIPYQISSPMLRRLFAHEPPPSRAVIMFQKEFADRLVAAPGGADYCRLSVNTQLLCGGAGGVRILMRVGREQFRPPPKVDSAVAELLPLPGGWRAVCAAWPPQALGGGASAVAYAPPFAEWDVFLRIAFSGKNKTLRAIMSNKSTLAALLQASPARGGGGEAGGAGGLASGAEGESSGGHVCRAFADAQAERNGANIADGASNGIAGGSDVGGGSAFDGDDGDSDADDDDGPVSVAGWGDGVNATLPRIPLACTRRSHVDLAPDRAAVLQLRRDVHAALEMLRLGDRRPNALLGAELQALFRALHEGLGLRFIHTPGMRKGAGRRHGAAEEGAG